MSGYAGQEKHIPVQSRPSKHERIIDYQVAEVLLQQALENPGGGEEALLLNAVKGNWRITFPRTEGYLTDFDDIVGNMNKQRENDNPVIQAFGELVAHSLNYNHADDGK